jgi:hypothetical protein
MGHHTASQAVIALAAVLFLPIESGCTFVTSCPTGDNNPARGGAGGAGGAGNAGVANPNAGAGGGAPVPMGVWRNVSGNLANMPSECGNMTSVFVKPDEDVVIAGVAALGLWASRAGSPTWVQMGTGAGSDSIINRPTSLVYDPDDSNRFWESGIYNGPGVFETKDDGDTFTALGNTLSNDLVSVDLADAKRKTLLAGGHEQPRSLRRSTDGGLHWVEVGDALPAATNCTLPLVIDAQTYLVGCGGYGGGPVGVYRSTDSGKTWSSMVGAGGGAAPLRASDGSIYWSSPGNSGMVRSTDDGLTWTDADPTKATRTSAVAELPDGRIAAFGANGIIVSADQGATWVPATTALPYTSDEFVAGFTYSAQQNAFFVWHNTCGFSGSVPVPEDAIMRYDFDYKVD